MLYNGKFIHEPKKLNLCATWSYPSPLPGRTTTIDRGTTLTDNFYS